MPDTAVALLVALVVGAAVGVEREWSGHASGPAARFAGIRTFALLGLLSGLAGRLWFWNAPWLAAVLLLAAGALVVAAYASASRHDIDATTEVAALAVLAAGTAAGLGQIEAASGAGAVMALLLSEKSRLHRFVATVQGAELSAAFRFAVMAVVVLPLLPPGPFGPWGGLRPRQLWILVLFFSGLSFAGYVARRIIGESRGYPLAGLLGGIVSSTSVTLSFARSSRVEHGDSAALALGVIAANTVLYVRVAAAAVVLSPALALALAPRLAIPFVVGSLAVGAGLARLSRPGATAPLPPPRNPLQLRSALELAVLFQVVLMAVHLAEDALGSRGVLATAALVGLTDADALTVSMARSVDGGLAAELGARAVAVGLLSNTLLKSGLAIAIGEPRFRTRVAAVLLVMAAALAIAAWRG